MMTNSIDSSSLLAGIVKYSDEWAANQREQSIIITCNGDYIVHHADVRSSDVSMPCVKAHCDGQPHTIEKRASPSRVKAGRTCKVQTKSGRPKRNGHSCVGKFCNGLTLQETPGHAEGAERSTKQHYCSSAVWNPTSWVEQRPTGHLVEALLCSIASHKIAVR